MGKKLPKWLIVKRIANLSKNSLSIKKLVAMIISQVNFRIIIGLKCKNQ